jgi:hypothetical protein
MIIDNQSRYQENVLVRSYGNVYAMLNVCICKQESYTATTLPHFKAHALSF